MDAAHDPAIAAALRRRMRDARTALRAPDRLAAAERVADLLEQLPEFLVDARVAGYWAIDGELPLHIVVARLRARGQVYHLPVVDGDTIRFAPLQPDSTLVPNRYGIPEPDAPASACLAPAAVELVLVPLTAFDRRGGRLGMGGGYYDRSFAFLRAQARPAQPLLVGVAYAFQEVPALSAQTHDLPMDFIVTDRELIDCTVPTET